MKILFARRGSYLPELRAGTEITTHYQCTDLIARGHEVAVACSTEKPCNRGFLDQSCGYPVYRGPTIAASIEVAVAADCPDVIVLLEPGGWANDFSHIIRGIPLVLYQHSVRWGIRNLADTLGERPLIVASSETCASRLITELGVPAVVVPPIFGIDRFASVKPCGESVLFVSLQRRKGGDVAAAIAEARPGFHFNFVESWSEQPDETAALRGRLGRLPNVTLQASMDDLGPVFAQTRLLLMPSRSQEGWGRMVTEAQTCGIPALASSRGQLPNTVGKGGECLDPDDPLSDWLAAFDRIMADKVYWSELSSEARTHAGRIIASKEDALNRFERVLKTAIGELRPEVELFRKPVAAKSRASWTNADMRTGIRLGLALPQAWCLPQAAWPAVTRWSSGVGAKLAGKSHEISARRMGIALERPARETAAFADEVRAARHEVALQCLRDFRPGGWDAEVSASGFDRVREFHAAGQGCVLWVAHFVFATNVVKMAFRREGLDVAHVSRPDHGFSSSHFGIRLLNPVRTRFEARYLSERIVFERSRPVPAMRRIKSLLDGSGIVSFTAGAWEGGHLARAPFLGSHFSISTGPASIARASGAALLPVFGVRLGGSRKFGGGRRFLVKVGEPIDVQSQSTDDEAMRHAAADHLSQLAPWVLRYPGQWRGWSSMEG